jgi:DNA excision repair protein ERCC-2
MLTGVGVALQVSRELEKDCVVVFDEAHNIDNVCIEALSVNLRDKTLSAAARNLTSLQTAIQRCKQIDAERLQQEYSNLVQGLHAAGVLSGWHNDTLANPALPQDILNEAVPGNIRRSVFLPCPLHNFDCCTAP